MRSPDAPPSVMPNTAVPFVPPRSETVTAQSPVTFVAFLRTRYSPFGLEGDSVIFTFPPPPIDSQSVPGLRFQTLGSIIVSNVSVTGTPLVAQNGMSGPGIPL